MYNCDSFSERCAFEGTRSTCEKSTFWSNTCLILGESWVSTPVSHVLAWVGFGILWVVLNTSMTKSYKSRAGKPSIRKPACTNDLRSSCFIWISGDILRTLSGLLWLASPEFGPHHFEAAPWIQTWFAAMNSPVQQVNIAIFPIEVNGFSIVSLLENSTVQRSYSLEYRMSWILKNVHHLWRTKIPLATLFGCFSLISLAFFSGSPRMLRVHQ